MGQLSGKIAVVTGGNSGIGFATAREFAKEGAFVFITGRRQAELDAAVAALGENVTGVQGDISNLADLDRLYATVKAEKGRIDVLFANAGGGEFVPFEQITEAHVDKTFNINVKGTLFTVQKALPLLSEGSSVILTGSIAGVKGSPAFSVYSATKAAIRSFARNWILDLKPRKIRINVLSPGPVTTPAIDGLLPSEAEVKQLKAGLADATALGRMGEPVEVARAAVFLASDDSSFMTGAELSVDGGMAQI